MPLPLAPYQIAHSEQVRVADAHAAKDLLRWAPKVPLEESLKRTIEWYERKLSLSICDQPISIT
jgi:nucleoside-diphosphate-sugar epimerase